MEVITKVIFAVIVGMAIGALLAYPVMWLWNDLMPLIFGLIRIDFEQAWEISILCHFLFKSNR